MTENEMMNKKILILCYDFPPYNSIGAQRPYNWYKFFNQYGIYPVVITRHWGKNIKCSADCYKPSENQTVETSESGLGTVIRVPFKPNIRDRIILKYGLNRFSRIRKVLSFVLSIARMISFRFDNTANIYREAEKYLVNNKCSLIIATGEPFVLFRYASKLCEKNKIPWIADYRDQWSTNFSIKHGGIFRNILTSILFARMEKRFVSNASLITTAAPPYQRELAKIHPAKKIEVIFNGYTTEIIEKVSHIVQNKLVFEIAYSGTIYPHQALEIFLEGYKNFIEQNKCEDTKAVFYGLDFYEEQKERLFAFNGNLNRFLVTTQRLPQNEVLQKLKSANVLLLLASNTTEQLVAKIFEYLALNSKILLVQDDKGILGKLMDECNGGIKCSNSEAVAKHLSILYNEHKLKGFIQHKSINYQSYNRKQQASRLAKLIHDHIN